MILHAVNQRVAGSSPAGGAKALRKRGAFFLKFHNKKNN